MKPAAFLTLSRLPALLGMTLPLLAALPFGSVQAQGLKPLALQKEDSDFRIQSAKFLGDDDVVCLAGRYLKDDEARNYGRLMLIDLGKNKVLWEKLITPPEDANDLMLADCVRHGNTIHVAANVKLASKQMMVWLYQFDQSGKQLAAKALEVEGDNVLVDAIGVADGSVMVSGVAQGHDAADETWSLFLSRLDASFKPETRLIKKGGFRSGASMKWVGKHLLVGGYFLPQKLNRTESVNDYANAKLTLAGNYVWSVRPQAPDAERSASAIDAAGNVFSLSASKAGTTLAGVDINGKPLQKMTSKSRFCDTTSMAALDVNLLAVRKPCDGSKRASLVLIDKKTGKEAEPGLGKEEPVLVFSHTGRWGLISKDDKGMLAVQSGKTQRTE